MKLSIVAKSLCVFFMIFSPNTATHSLKAHKVQMSYFFTIRIEESKSYLIIKVNLELIFNIVLRSQFLQILEVQFKIIKKIGLIMRIILTNFNKLSVNKK